MKIINNKTQIIGKDGKIIILPTGQKIALCTFINNLDKEVIYATFIEEVDGNYYIYNGNVKDNQSLDDIIFNYLSNNLVAKEINADNIVVHSYDVENVINEEESNIIYNVENIDSSNIESPKIYAILEIDEANQVDLNIFKYESIEDVTLAFTGENSKDYKFFRNIRLSKVINSEDLHFSSLKYFLEFISSLDEPITVEINGYSNMPPYNSKVYKVPIEYILINFKIQFVSTNNKNRLRSNCLADHFIAYDSIKGYCAHLNDSKSSFSNLNEYVKFNSNMSDEEYFYE